MLANPWWLLALATFILETVAAVAWWPAYFRIGLPIWRSSFRLPAAVVVLPAAATLQQDSRSDVTGNFVFKQLSDSEIAFREAQVGYVLIRYLPVMHGRLRFRLPEQRGDIVGFASFSAPFAIVFMEIGMPAAWRLPALPILATLLWGIPYGFQHFRYRKVRKLVDDYAAACVMASETTRQ